MNVDFGRGKWNAELFTQVTSLRTDGRQPFMQEDDCVVNDTAKQEMFAHNYISLISNEWFDANAVFETVCSFEKFGAPLIVFTDDIISTEDGYPAYGHHFEVVAFEEGINVWELNGTAKPILQAKGRFPVEAGKAFRLLVSVKGKELSISLDGNEMTCTLDNMPARFRAGITACEGVNRFRSFSAVISE